MKKDEKVILSGLVQSMVAKKYSELISFGEFIDNAIGQSEIGSTVLVTIVIDVKNGGSIYFIDNSAGIEESSLVRAWTFFNHLDAFKSNGMNRANVGFKRGGFWLGKKISIYSKTKNFESGTYLDINEVMEAERKQEEYNIYSNLSSDATNNLKEWFDHYTNNSETGSIFKISDLSWEQRDFAEIQTLFQCSPDSKTDTGAKGEMNIYKQLYWRYKRFIEGKENKTLQLKVIHKKTDGEFIETIINAKNVGYKGLTIDIEEWEQNIRPNIDFENIRFKNNFDKLRLDEMDASYGTNTSKIIDQLEEGNFEIDFNLPYRDERKKLIVNLPVKLYLLDHKKINSGFSSMRIISGIELIQDGRSLNTGTSVTDSYKLHHHTLKIFSKTGEFATDDTYWMAQIFVDFFDEANKETFKPNDEKADLASEATKANILSNLKDALIAMRIIPIFETVIPYITIKARPNEGKATQTKVKESADVAKKIKTEYEAIKKTLTSASILKNDETSFAQFATKDEVTAEKIKQYKAQFNTFIDEKQKVNLQYTYVVDNDIVTISFTNGIGVGQGIGLDMNNKNYALQISAVTHAITERAINLFSNELTINNDIDKAIEKLNNYVSVINMERN
jgi:hypothetical protein